MAGNRSTSEVQTKSLMRKNPSTRSSEISNPMRRSFSGNPFGKPSGVAVSRGFSPATPANSPSEYARSSVDRNSKLFARECEEKENGMDRMAKQSRGESPCLTKATKNFMSPTISAASKINASPRKKILAEKNELVRTSWGSLNVSDEASVVSSDIEAPQSHDSMVTESSSSRSKDSLKKKVVFDSNVQMIPATDSDIALSNDEAEKSDCFDVHEADNNNNVEKSPSIKSPRSLLAPLDADPLMPPYDPQTNYLSPRPQFLHYRPSPRIKHFFGKETGSHYLDDSFNVEGFSETELTEETSSDDSPREPQNDLSGELEKEVNGNRQLDIAQGEAKVDVTRSHEMNKEAPDAEDVLMSDPSCIAASTDSAMIRSDEKEIERTVAEEVLGAENPGATMVVAEEVLVAENPRATVTEVKQVVNGSTFFTKSKCLTLIVLVLLAGLVARGDRTVIQSFGISNSNESILRKIVEATRVGEEYVKVNLDGMAQNLWHLYAVSWDHMSGLIRQLRDKGEISRLNYYNLSSMQEDLMFEKEADNCLLLDHQNHKLNWVDNWMKHDAEAAPLEEEDNVGNEGAVSHVTSVAEEDLSEDSESEAEEQAMGSDMIEEESSEDADPNELPILEEEVIHEEVDVDAINGNIEEKFEVDQGKEPTDDSPATKRDAEEKLEIDWGKESIENTPDDQIQFEYSQPAETQVESSEVVKANLESGYRGDGSSTVAVVAGVSILVLILTASAGFVYFKTKRVTMAAPTSKEAVLPELKKFDISPVAAIHAEEHQSLVWLKKWATPSCPTVVDMAGESCPSEMSSFQKNSFRSEGQQRVSEVQSRGKKPRNNHRRESFASSSSDFSMGSPSYGSFTTYEKVPYKHRNGEEEVVVTPIRRSSRLLKQIASP